MFQMFRNEGKFVDTKDKRIVELELENKKLKEQAKLNRQIISDLCLVGKFLVKEIKKENREEWLNKFDKCL